MDVSKIKWRNAVDNGDGTIDCEVDHPEFGWIPFTVTDYDTEPLGVFLNGELKGPKKGMVGKKPYQPKQGFEVNDFRDNRLLHGNRFQPAGYDKTVHLRGDGKTQMYLAQRHTDARMRIVEGRSAGFTYQWRDEDNVVHVLTVAQMVDLGNQAATWFEKTIQAAWAIKDDPKGIEDDFDKDSRWP